MKRQNVVTILGIAAFLFAPSLAHAADPVPLGTLSTYGVVSSTFSNTAAGTSINGTAGQPALCYTTAPAFPATVTGLILVPCPAQAGQDQIIATADLNAQANATCTPIPDGVDLNAIDVGGGPGRFTPGCYTRAGALTIVANGIVVLDGPGVYIFRSTGGGLTTGADSAVTMEGGACESDVNWGLTGAATLGANSDFVGNILTTAGIGIGLNATLTGRALTYPETVTTTAPVTITVPTCAALPPPPPPLPPGIPALDYLGLALLTVLLAGVGMFVVNKF